MPIEHYQTDSLRKRNPIFAIFCSVLLAMILTLYPWPVMFGDTKPAWLLSVLFFWTMYQPAWCSIWFAFFLGLLTDLILQLPLGLHALIFVVVTFTAHFIVRYRRTTSWFDLTLLFMLITLIYLLIFNGFLYLTGNYVDIVQAWQPWLSTIICWLFWSWGLNKWRTL